MTTRGQSGGWRDAGRLRFARPLCYLDGASCAAPLTRPLKRVHGALSNGNSCDEALFNSVSGAVCLDARSRPYQTGPLQPPSHQLPGMPGGPRHPCRRDEAARTPQ